MAQKTLDFAKFQLAAVYTPTGASPDTTITVIAVSEIYNLDLQRQGGTAEKFRLTLREKTDPTKKIRVGIEDVASSVLVGDKMQYVLNIRLSSSGNLMVGLANDDDGTDNDDNIIATNLSDLELDSFSKGSAVNLNVGTGEFAELETIFNENVLVRFASFYCFDKTTDVTIGEGRAFLPTPSKYNTDKLSVAKGFILGAAGTTGDTTIQIYNVTQGYDMLSTPITIASGAIIGSGVIDTTKAEVLTDDVLRVDIDSASATPPKGLTVNIEFAN